MKLGYCVFTLLLIAGCRTSVNTQNRYVLNAERAPAPADPNATGVLDVHRLTIDRTYDFKDLVYRKGENAYEVDYYNGFLVAPSQIITERTRHWLARAGLFARVLNPGSQAPPTHALEGHILKLYGDYRDKHNAIAILEIKYILVDLRYGGQSVLLNQTYRETQALDEPDAQNLITALDQCLERTLHALEEDVSRVLTEESHDAEQN